MKDKLWSVYVHGEIFVRAKDKEEAIDMAWHDIMCDTEDVIKVDEPAEIDEG